MKTTNAKVTFKGKRGSAFAYYVVEYTDIRFVIWYDSIDAEKKDVKMTKKEMKSLFDNDAELKGIVFMCKRDLKTNYLNWKKACRYEGVQNTNTIQ